MPRNSIKYYVLSIKGLLKLFVFLLLATYYILHTTSVHAQTSTQSAIPSTVAPTSPIYTDLLVHNLFHTFSCLSIGSSIIGQPCLTYQITQNAQGAIQGIPVLSSANLSGGLLGTTTGLIAGLYANPPVRTIDYLASVGEGLGIVKPAHAQVIGSGAQVLNPIVKLWQVSRNISYVIMIIIFVIIGFMVMFRQRINPQTVITAQAALPGLVIGLILITFSYFFAALISDTAFIGTNLVGYYFAAAQERPPQNLVDELNRQNGNVLRIFSNFADAIGRGDIERAISEVFNNTGANINFWLRSFASIIAFQFGAQLGGAIPLYGPVIGFITGIVTGLAAAALTEQILGFVFWFIAIAVLIYAMLRLLLRLISAFLTIIFLTISAPFQFLAASLPGRQGIATGWILNMLANILIFPAVLAVFYFVAFILGRDFGPLRVTDATLPTNSGFTPVVFAQEPIRIVGEQTFPLFGGMDLNFITILLAFGALIALPKIPDLVVSTVGRMGQAGQLLGQEISGSIKAGQGYFGQYRAGVGGALQTTTTGIGGERTWTIGPGGQRIPIIQRVGLVDLFRGRVAPGEAKEPRT